MVQCMVRYHYREGDASGPALRDFLYAPRIGEEITANDETGPLSVYIVTDVRHVCTWRNGRTIEAKVEIDVTERPPK